MPETVVLSVSRENSPQSIERYQHLFEGHEEAVMERLDATVVTESGRELPVQ